MFKLIDKLGDNVNLLHIDPSTRQLLCEDGSLKYVPYKKSFNDNATVAYNKQFINNYEQLKSTLIFYFGYLNEIHAHHVYLKGGNAMFVYYIKSRMYPLCNTHTLSGIFHNTELATSIAKDIGEAFALSDVDIGVELHPTDYDNEAIYRHQMDTICQILAKIQTQLNLKFSSPENETMRAQYLVQLAATFNAKRTTETYSPQPSAIDVYDVNEGSVATRVADSLYDYDDIDIVRIGEKERAPIKYKESPYTPDDFAYVDGVDWVAIKTGDRKSLYRFAPKGTNWNALTFNNMLAFSFNSFSIAFDLFRIKLNIRHNVPSNQFTFASEVLDVGIHNKHDIAYIMTHDANVNRMTDPLMVTMDIAESTQTFHMVNKITILLDLSIILFIKTTVPWTDNKYGKRITRFFFLLATIPELDSMHRFLISTLVTIWMKLHNVNTIDALPMLVKNVVRMYFDSQSGELARIMSTNVDDLYTMTDGSTPIYSRMTVSHVPVCDVLVKFCILALKSIKNQIDIGSFINQFAQIVPVIDQRFRTEFANGFNKFLEISIKYAVCFYIMKSQITSYTDLYRPMYGSPPSLPPSSYGSLYRGSLWGGQQETLSKEIYDVAKQDYQTLKQLQTYDVKPDVLQDEDNLHFEEPPISLEHLQQFSKKFNDYLFGYHPVVILPSNEPLPDVSALDGQ